jgi:hypothetical protein
MNARAASVDEQQHSLDAISRSPHCANTPSHPHIRRNATPIMAAIEQRLAEWARLPVIHGEDMQV